MSKEWFPIDSCVIQIKLYEGRFEQIMFIDVS